MYQVEDEPIETIHLYVVRENGAKPSIFPIALSTLSLFLVIAVGVLFPYRPPLAMQTVAVPAIFLPLQSFTATKQVIPTGSKNTPATTAHGILTITNGSILAEELPKGLILTGRDGVQVTTDAAVFVPAGSATGYAVAYVSAHASISGTSGNIPSLEIDRVEGTSIYIRNVQAFTGGKDAFTVRFATAQDRQVALTQARANLMQHVTSKLLSQPCSESVAGLLSLTVIWTCQFFSYEVPRLPGIKVLHVQLVGRSIVLNISYVVRPRVFPGK